MKMFYYVAYGSNLNQQVITRFCPSVRVVGTGEVKGYTLAFRNRGESGYLTVIPEVLESVPVAVYHISKREEPFLDRYECYPSLYRKEYVDVFLASEKIRGMIYIMNDYYLGVPMEYCLPTKDYFLTCLAGYQQFGFNYDKLEQAINNTRKKMISNGRR